MPTPLWVAASSSPDGRSSTESNRRRATIAVGRPDDAPSPTRSAKRAPRGILLDFCVIHGSISTTLVAVPPPVPPCGTVMRIGAAAAQVRPVLQSCCDCSSCVRGHKHARLRSDVDFVLGRRTTVTDSPLRCTHACAREARAIEPKVLLARFMQASEVLSSSTYVLVAPFVRSASSRLSLCPPAPLATPSSPRRALRGPRAQAL
ncbi:hypothetical protein C8R45DRAFT_1157263 [Mycena sanguinolenta]|nr:hypothetical protein C8R45DRAFT_1157263 [Mycena sanguinolenta]